MYTNLSSELDCTCTWLLLHIYIHFVLDIYLGGSKACVCLALEDIAKHFAKVVIPIYIPSSNIWDFHLLHILSLVGSGFCLFCSVLFVLSHSAGWSSISLLFKFAFLWCFSYAYWTSANLLLFSMFLHCRFCFLIYIRSSFYIVNRSPF